MRRLKDQSGSILLLVLVAAPIAAILFFSLIDMALVSRRQSVINRNVVGYSAVLDAAIDYTTYAIKARWCMTPQWQRDLSGTCDMTHPKNLERLILDPQAIAAYYESHPGPATPLVLDSVTGTVNVATIPTGHPLLDVIHNMDASGGTKAVQDIEIKVERIDNKNVPRRGRESYLLITASLISSSTTVPFFRGFTALRARSRIMVAPRELNYFSVIVPRNLYLDGTGGAKGDLAIPTGTGGRGVAFESPVYVNGDVYVPSATATSYTNATFSSKLIVGGATPTGGGRLMSGGAPLAAPSSGNKDSVYSFMNGFGGFKKGVDMDTNHDRGLDVLATIAPPSVPLSGTTMQCLRLNKVKSDLTETKDTDLAIRQVSYTDSGGSDAASDIYKFNIGLTQENYFVKQDVKTYVRSAITNPLITNVLGTSILWVKIKIGNGIASAGNPNGMIRELTMQAGNPATTGPNTATLTLTDPSGVSNPSLILKLEPYFYNGLPQPHIKTLTVEATGRKAAIGKVTITLQAFDLGSWAGRDRRVKEVTPGTPADYSLGMDHNIEGSMFFQTNVGNKMVLTTNTVGAVPIGPTYVKMDETKRAIPLASPPNEAYDYQSIIDDCQSTATVIGTSSAFAAADWGKDFSSETRHTWHFAPSVNGPAPLVGFFYLSFQNAASNMIIPNTVASTTSSNPFEVKSIVGNCVIPSTTTFVAGFFVCDRFTIQARALPLMLVGTYIINESFIDPSAVSAGITFRSIYHPQVTADLIAKKILTDNFGGVCDPVPTVPVWWPELNPEQYTKMRSCSVLALRDKANPFTWTSVDPDCGLAANGVTMTCKRHPVNFVVTEISRESDLQ